MNWEQLWATAGVAAAIATALATGTSTVVALWWRRQDRPEADWAFSRDDIHREGSGRPEIPDPAVFSTHLSNAGDGTAFRVRVRGEHCTTGLASMQRGVAGRSPYEVVPAMHPGDQVYLWVTAEDDAWDEAEFVLEWTPSPTRKRKRLELRQRLAELGPLPEPNEMDPETGRKPRL